ncbi:hypothetical protein [Nocardiopsis nanhaiensis]
MGRSAAALALAAGKSIEGAAAEANVHRRTVKRWTDDDEFNAEVRKLRGQILERAAGALQHACLAAVETLVGCLGSDSDTVRVQSARAILTGAVAFREAVEVNERLAAIEDSLAERGEAA